METSQGGPSQADHVPETIERLEAGERAVSVVLAVDPNETLRGLCVNVLEARGYGAFGVATAEEAARIVEARPDIAVVLTALDLPGRMTGRNLVQHLQVTRPSVGVVVVSGALGPVAEVPGVEALAKPFGIEELLRVIERASNRHLLAEAGELASADCWD